MRFDHGKVWFPIGGDTEIGFPAPMVAIGGWFVPFLAFAAAAIAPKVLDWLLTPKPEERPQTPRSATFSKILNAMPWVASGAGLIWGSTKLPKDWKTIRGVTVVSGIGLLALGAFKMLSPTQTEAKPEPKRRPGSKPEDRTPPERQDIQVARDLKERLKDKVRIVGARYWLNEYYGVVYQWWSISLEVLIKNDADIPVPWARVVVKDLTYPITVLDTVTRDIPPHTTRRLVKDIGWSEWGTGYEVEWETHFPARITVTLADGTVLDDKTFDLKPIKR